MLKRFALITLLCLTLTLKPNCSNAEICFERSEIEQIKNRCEIDRARADRTEAALEKLLLEPDAVAFYQEKPFVIGHALVTAILLALVAGHAATR